MPCSKYKGAQRRACYATDEWSKPGKYSGRGKVRSRKAHLRKGKK